MSSRKEQKEQARQQRLAKEQAAADRAGRVRRMQVMGGVLVTAIIVVIVAIAISSGGSPAVKLKSPAATAAVKHVDSLLAGIPESGNTLGNPNARITITEYGDLECSVCDVLATPPSFTNPENEAGSGWEDQMITQYVRTGKAKLVYRSLETASSSNPDQNAFEEQQVAAEAAGMQDKEWYYIELMYNEQGQEGTDYVSQSYLDGLAQQIRGLDIKQWMADRNLASFKSEVTADNQAGETEDAGSSDGVSTPTIVVKGPRGQIGPISGLPQAGYSVYESAIAAVS
jgi:protein-disulfide isomerase